MRRWRRLRLSNSAVIEYEARPVESVRKAFARAAADAGLVGVSPHMLRHTSISWAVQAGVDIYRVADFFGVTVPLDRALSTDIWRPITWSATPSPAVPGPLSRGTAGGPLGDRIARTKRDNRRRTSP